MVNGSVSKLENMSMILMVIGLDDCLGRIMMLLQRMVITWGQYVKKIEYIILRTNPIEAIQAIQVTLVIQGMLVILPYLPMQSI